jgi:hypothetical protein
MADRAKTGNVLLDAWIDALNPLLSGMAANDGAASDPTQPTAPPFSFERMFLGGWTPSSVDGFTSWPGATARLTEVWSDLAQRSMGVMAALGATSNAGDPLGKALEQSFGVMGEVGGAAAEGPALLAQAAKAASVLFAAREAYRAVMLATWQRAFEEVTREAVQRAGEGKPVTTPSQWLSFSNAVADRVFVQAFNSQKYIDAQRQLLTALADQRLSETKLVEFFARFGHFPTRRALDDVSEEVNELRRRIRRLERAGRSTPGRRRKAKAVDDR